MGRHWLPTLYNPMPEPQFQLKGGDLVDQDKYRPPRRLWLAGLAGLALLATGCATATNELNPGQEALKVTAKPPLGPVLADDSGHTVYMFAKDEAGESYCTGACASVWVPVTTKAMPTTEGGLNPHKVTLLKRDGGLMQVVYNGHPLYYYQADTGSSDAYGQEQDQFGAEWYALTPAGNQAENNMRKGGNGYGS